MHGMTMVTNGSSSSELPPVPCGDLPWRDAKIAGYPGVSQVIGDHLYSNPMKSNPIMIIIIRMIISINGPDHLIDHFYCNKPNPFFRGTPA